MLYRDKLTKYVKNLIEINNNDKRLVNQFVLNEYLENNDNINEIEDVAGDKNINKIKGIYHRYPNKLLIFPTEKCLGSCRFCFRKNIIDDNDLTIDDIENIVDYIKLNNIKEVIFSGGDPFAVEEKLLIEMIKRIQSISEVKIVRIHTRALTYNPEIITQNFIDNVKSKKPLYLVFHINSHLELSEEAIKIINNLTDNGILCFSQSALLKDVNDNIDDLNQLFSTLIENKIKPYYLFHPDRVKGTGHFYIPIKRGIMLYNNLYNYISGLAMPIYLFNIPNGHGHCIIDLQNIKQLEEDKYSIRTWENKEIIYNDISYRGF